MGQLNEALERARDHLLSRQEQTGYWVFDLEADVTITAEYLLLQRFLGRNVSSHSRERMTRYLRRRQLPEGGWPLFEGGSADLSASVKAYFALKIFGDPPAAPHMVQARYAILSLGGAARVNVFTRITLALFGQIPWHTTPAMPIEIMLLPRRFFFHLSKVSYWSRTVMVPLLLLCSKKPVCSLRDHEAIPELFIEPPGTLRHLDRFSSKGLRKNLFILLDRVLKKIDRFMPARTRQKAVRRAERWTRDRMQGEGGIGAIFPAMANAVMALEVLGHTDDPDMKQGIRALDELLLDRGDESFCQPCHSPIWDCALSLTALLEAGLPADHDGVQRAVDWLMGQQIFFRGDWADKAGNLAGGGWAFQFENTFYPDVDDTPVVVMALLRAGAMHKQLYRDKLTAAVHWVLGMQSSDGGWGAFDIDNNHLYLNDIPFADHGALLDPSTSDLTGRGLELLSMLGYPRSFPAVARALTFLYKEQEEWGAWYGRWGVNYLYGTWSVLMGLRQAGEDMGKPAVQRAVDWIKSCQNPDHGWGETCYSYNDPALAGRGPSTPSQTSWALLSLMAAGEVNDPAVQKGIGYLIRTQDSTGIWHEQAFTGTGFPRVFYLRYHGYRQYFPLWALGLFRRLRSECPTCQDEVSGSLSPPDWPRERGGS